MRKYERDLRALVERCGASVVRVTGSGHFLLRRADGKTASAASTPSDHRALRNIERYLTRGLSA